MNKIYKVIWNAALQCWVAVSELGKAKGKTKSKKVLSAAALATLVSTAIVGNVKAAIEAGSGAGLAIQSQKTSAQYGAFAKADAATSTAIGYLVVAESNHALAIGSQTQAIGEKTVAIGHLSRATGTESTALGVNATAKGNGDIALGKHAVAQGGADGVTGSAALGDEAKATGAQSAAVGGKSNASGSHAVASGYNTQATGGSSSAIGDAAEASGNQATAVGVSSVAGGTASSAFGGGAKATGYYSLAAGTQANATHSGSTAVGGEAQATNEKTTAVGSSSKASGSWATATGASANASGEASAAFGESATASGKKSIATGSHASASGENAIASGKNAKALASNTTAIGADANATSNAVNSTVIGRGAVVNATDATVIGPVAQAHGANATAIGRGAAANGTESTALGRGAAANGTESTALGRGSVANGNQSTALGKGSSVTVDSGVALGDGAVANRVALDKNTIQINTQNLAATTGLSDNNNGGDANTVYAPVKLVDAPGALEAIKNTVMGNKGAVSVGDANNTRQIINVAPGSADSDAVNVAQLKAVAGAIKKYSVTSPDGSITITDPATGDDPQNFQIQMNTTAVRNAAAWKIKDNGKADSTAAEVKGGDVVDFRGTNSVKVERSGRDLTFSANTASIIGNSDGSVKSRASDAYSTTNTAPADWLVTSINVADAINKSGWQLQANGSRVGLVNPGDKVNFEAGNGVTITPTNESNGVSKLNIAAKVDNSTISYNSKGELQANTNYGWSIKTANTTAVAVPNGQAVSLNEGQYINITHNGRDLQFNAKTADVGMNTTTGATNQATATGLATNKAVADAIQASGFQLKENGTLKNVVNPGESLNFKPGQGTTVSVGTNGDVQVNANVADIKAGNNVTVTNNSGVYTINANDTNTQVTVTNATSSPITIATTQNTNGTSHYTVDVNVDGTTIKKENGVLKAIIPAVETVTLNVNTTGNNAGKVDAPKDADKGKLVTAENVAKAINESFWIAKKGTRVETNNDNATTAESNIAAGNNVTFIAGKNIALEKKGNAFIYATKDDVSFNNVTANNSVTNNLTVNPNNTAGSTFKVGGNTTVDMGGNQIHNVSNGTAPTDAVNLSQLNASAAAAKTEVKAGKNVSSVNESKDAKDGHTIYTIDTVDNSAHVQAAANNAAVKVEKATATRADGNTTVTDYTVDLTDATKTNITHGVNANETVTNKGLTFNGNTGSTGAKKLGSTVDVKGGDKVITTTATTAGITINYNGTEAAKVTNLTYKANGDNAQNVSLATGLNFKNGNGTTVTVGADGEVTYNANVSGLTAGDNVQITNDGKGNFTIAATDTNTQSSVVNVTSSPVTVAVSDNTNGTKQYAVDVNVDGTTITKEGGVLKAIIPAVEKVDLTVNKTGDNAGKVETPADADKGKLVTAENVAKAVNESFWIAKKGDRVETNADTTSDDSNIAAGNNVTFIAGKNIALQKDGNKFIYATKDDVSFNNVTANNTTTTNLTVNNGGNVDMGNNKVKNVGAGNVTSTSTEAVNGSQLYAVDSKFNNTVSLGGDNSTSTGTQALNKDGGLKFNIVGAENGNITTTASGTDVKVDLTQGTKDDIKQGVDANTTVTNKGLTFNGNTGNTGAKKLGSEVDVKGGDKVITTTATTAGITINYNGTEAAKVTNLTYKANGDNAQNVSLATGLNFKNGNGTTVTVGADGEVTYNANVSGLTAGDNVQITNDGKGNFTIAATDTNTQSSVVNVTSSPVTVAVSDNTNGTKQYAVDVNVDGTTITKEGGVLKAIIPAVEKVDLTVNKTGDNAGKVETPADADKGKLVTAENVAKAVNESFWIAKKGDRVETNADTTSDDSNIAAGNNVTFIAGKNIALQKDGNKFIYATKDDVSFNNVTANNTTTTNLTVNNGGNVDMGNNKVKNVGAGNVTSTSTEAVNGSQLYAVDSKFNNTVSLGGDNSTSTGTQALNKDGGLKFNIVGAENGNITTTASGTDVKVDLTQGTKDDIKQGVDANTTVTNKGLTFNGNTGNTGAKKLGSEVDVKGGDKVITTNATTAGITINYNGTEAAKVTNLTYKANGANAQSVNLTTGLDFTNGTQTTAEVAANGVVKFNVNTTALSNVTNNGKITVPDGNGLVTAKEVAEAINASYWKANAGGNVDGTTTADNVTTGTEVFFAAGKNLKVKHTANNFTFSTADDVSFNNVTANNVTAGNTTTTNLTVNNGGNVDMGGNQVHNVANGTKGSDAVNLSQLNATTAIANAGWKIKANGNNETTVKPNATVSLNNTDGNILITKTSDNNDVTFNLNPNTTFGVVGKDGKDGVDGSIGVNGKDGASVVINGKDGSIGLTGPKGADGKDGVSVTLKPEKGTTTVNATDGGKEIDRIKYTANGTTREVATLDDGLKFAGDDNKTINRTLGSLLNITGGATDSTTANNIRVTNDGKNGLRVQLANNVTFDANGSVKIGNTTVNNGGLTINGGPSITKDSGVNAGNKAISNVSTGVKDNDAVNVKQLKDSVSTESVVAKTGTDNIAEVSPKAGQTLGDKNAQYEVSVSKAKVKDAAVEAVKVNATTGSPITVTTTADAANNSTTYTVNFNGDNAAKEIPLTYKSNGNASTAKTVKLSDGLDFTNGTLTTAVVGDNGVVKFNVNQGAFNTTIADVNGKLNNASKEGVATVEEVIKAVNAAGWVVTSGNTSTGTVSGTSREVINPGDAVKFIAGQNVDITQDKGNFTIATRENVSFTTVTVGKDGKDGKDGSIGVNGKDGASVVINGKDGSIGLTGPKGADGKDGVSVTLKPEKGTTTVNAKDDGKEIDRIKYTANGTTREVATLDDGLKFKGDSKQVINRTLGSQMNITGGADETTLTDNNIGVVYDKVTDGLKVKLAKDVNLTSNGSVTIGNTTLNNNGFTITNKADPSKTVSVTDKGLNNGGNTIINVAPGVNGTDAVNLDQLNATTAIANAGWVIKANGTNATTVKPNATVSLNNTDGNILITKNKTDNNVTFNLNPNTTFGVKGKDGVDGSIGVNGKDGSSVVINGKDGSIGLNGKDGKNGLSIKGDQGPAGVDGKDGETKTRIVYEYADPKDPNKTIRENVATLNDGLRFTGNNGVRNNHKLNTLVTIIGEGVDKAASANFTSASGNINVKADGKGTLEVQLAKNMKNIETINNGNSTITLNKDGGTTISGGDVSVDGNKVTNVKDGDVSANSKDAVNGSQLYHVMTNATAGWNLSVNNGKDKGNVKPGAQVDLNNTDGNIIISKNANNVTFNFNPNATFGVKGKDGKGGVDGSISVNGNDGSSVVLNGKGGSIGLTGPKGADGKDGASANMSVQKGTTTVNTDRDGGKEVTRIVYTDKDKDGKDIKREVATLDDGLKFKGDSEQVINRTLGSQMNITGGADSTKLTDNNIGVVYDEATNGLKVKLSKDVDLGKDGSITIGGTQVTNNGLTIKGGPSVTEKGVDAGNKKVTNVADGDINATSKDAVNGSQLYQAVNNINKNVNAAKTELEEGDNVTITSRVGNNGQTIYKVSSTDNSAHVQGGSDAVSVTKAETTRKDGSTTVTDYTVDLSSKTKDDIKKGVDAHDTVTNKGLTFNADKGTTGAKKLGSQVAVNGDNKNIETVADTNGVKVKLKDDINVNSVTANTFKAGDTIVNTKGVQVAAKDDRGNNTNVVINEKGINAGNTRIQNVAAGRADTDAVNVSQLKGAVTQIGNHINKMDKNLRAGIAGAMAAGGLYHATLPGKSMVAAGAGTYKGESAVAVGYSRLSDNGKVGIKFSVNTNTRGDSGAAASVGYQW